MGSGKFQQLRVSGWFYYMDDQDMQIHADYTGNCLSAVCLCGGTIYLASSDKQKWRLEVLDKTFNKPGPEAA